MAAFLTAVLRLALPVEFSFTHVLHSPRLLPALQALWARPVGSGTHTVGSWLCLIWAGGCIFFLLRLFLHLRGDYAAIRCCQKTEDRRVSTLVTAAAPKAGICHRVYLSPDISVPCVCGFFTPVFLLPQSAGDLSDQELELIARHEWHHFHCGDVWYKLAMELLICLLWWNLPVYLLRRDMDQLLELRCDLSLTKGMVDEDRAAYLTTVMHSIQQQSPSSERQFLSLNLAGTSAGADIKQRFRIVAQQSRKQSLRTACCVCVLLAALWFGSLFVVIQPYTEPPEEDWESSSDILRIDEFYFVPMQDGTYDLYYYEQCVGSFGQEEIEKLPYKDIPIIKKEEQP